MENTEKKLKPCPFCKCTRYLEMKKDTRINEWYVKCKNCNVKMSRIKKADLIDAWNHQMGDWIPLRIQTPGIMQKCITTDKYDNVHVFTFTGIWFQDDNGNKIDENHPDFNIPVAWMPRPECYSNENE